MIGRMLTVLVLSDLALSAAAAPTGYTVVDLGASQQPLAINSTGTIAGFGPNGAEIYQDGTWQPLKSRRQNSVAEAINGKGVVVGQDGAKAVRWRGGKRQVLAGLGSGGTAEGISNDGTIVGTLQSGSDSSCYSWKAGVVTDLGSLGGGRCRAHAIDVTGHYIAGESYVPAGTGADHAFIVDGSGMHDLGVLPNGAYSWARAVNRHGHASVWADNDNSGDWAAAYWNGRKLIQVPGINANFAESFGGAINDQDEMLAEGYDAEGHVLFLYEGRTGTVTPIEPLVHNGSGWDFGRFGSHVVEGLANDGTIVGAAYFNGEQHGFMLVPDAQ